MGPQTSSSLFLHWSYQRRMMALTEADNATHWTKPSCSAVSDSSKFEAAESLTRQKKTSAYNYHNKTKTKGSVTVLLIVCFAAPNLCKICVSGSPKNITTWTYFIWIVKDEDIPESSLASSAVLPEAVIWEGLTAPLKYGSQQGQRMGPRQNTWMDRSTGDSFSVPQ